MKIPYKQWIEDAEFTEYNMIFKEDLPSWLIDFQSHLLSRFEDNTKGGDE
jgi:hypothetical protein